MAATEPEFGATVDEVRRLVVAAASEDGSAVDAPTFVHAVLLPIFLHLSPAAILDALKVLESEQQQQQHMGKKLTQLERTASDDSVGVKAMDEPMCAMPSLPSVSRSSTSSSAVLPSSRTPSDDITIETVERGPLGGALRAIPNHYIIIKSTIAEARVYDQDKLGEGKAFPKSLGLLLRVLLYFAIAITGLLIPLFIVFEPIAILGYTNTTNVLFGPRVEVLVNASVGCTRGEVRYANHTVDGDEPIPHFLTDICLGLHTFLCIALSYACLYLTLFNTNPAVVRLLWRESRTRLVATLGTACAYGISVASLMPKIQHVAWLILRTSILIYYAHADAANVSNKLRHTKQSFAKQFGSEETGKGWKTILFSGIGGVLFLGCDLLRHWLVLNASPVRSVLNFGTANPVTGNLLGWTYHQLAEACYFTSMLFTAQILYAQVKTHAGAHTTLLTTNFVLLFKEDAEETPVKRDSQVVLPSGILSPETKSTRRKVSVIRKRRVESCPDLTDNGACSTRGFAVQGEF